MDLLYYAQSSFSYIRCAKIIKGCFTSTLKELAICSKYKLLEAHLIDERFELSWDIDSTDKKFKLITKEVERIQDCLTRNMEDYTLSSIH